MKTAAKIFIIIGMVCGFWCIAPLIVGFFALDKLETARTKNELTGMAICTLLLCSTIAGVLMLCMPDSELAQNGTQDGQQEPYTEQVYQKVESQPKQQNKESETQIVANLDKLKSLKEQGILNDEEYEKLRKREVDKLLGD